MEQNKIEYTTCPHCGTIIEIISFNCEIFRCGIIKANNTQIDPHLSKEKCDELIKNDAIHGCGKPFRIKKVNGKYIYNGWLIISEICGYI